MRYWVTLHQTITAALKTERIGPPVFVRCTSALAASSEALPDHLAEMADSVCAWLADSVGRVYAVRSSAGDHLCVTLIFRSGRSAILTLTPAHGQPYLDLAILGSRGGIYHNEQVHPARDGSLAPQMPEQMADLLAAVERSLAGGRPVLLSGEEAVR